MFQTIFCLIWLTLFSFASFNLEARGLKPLLHGQLENGFTYYIQEHKGIEDQVSLKLFIKSGSLLEEDHEQGIAHFVEHMAFKGSTNFPEAGAIEALASLGANLGTELNAYTNFDHTIYKINLPLKKNHALDTALLILSDWAFDLTMSDEAIDSEREVIIDEARRVSSAKRLEHLMRWKTLVGNSQYSKRQPIGQSTIIKTASHEIIRGFYKKWYRPDLMGILVSGNVKAKKVKNRIKNLFSRKSKQEKLNPTQFKVPIQDQTDYVLINTPNRHSTSIKIFFKREFRLHDMKSQVTNSIYTSILHHVMAERFLELKENSQFYTVSSNTGHVIQAIKFVKFHAQSPVGEGKETLKRLFTEVERMRQHGSTEAEFKRAVANLAIENDLKRSRALQEQEKLCQDYFFKRSATLHLNDLIMMSENFAASVTLDQFNSWVNSELRNDGCVISAETSDTSNLSQNMMRELIKIISASNISAHKDEEMKKELFTLKVQNGSIENDIYHSSINTTEWLLGNGAKVVIKPTDFQKNEILIQGRARGGYNYLKETFGLKRWEVKFLCKRISIGSHLPSELKKLLAGKLAELNTNVTPQFREFNIKTRPQDLEVALQIIHLLFARGHYENKEFSLENLSKIPLIGHLENFSSFRAHRKNHDPTTIIQESTGTELEGDQKIENEMKHRTSLCRHIYEGPEDFTFIIVGNIKVAQIKKLVRKYIASLK